VRDFTGGAGGPAVSWDVRPVFDFLFSLSSDAGETEDLAPEDRRWLAEARAGLPEDARAGIEWMYRTELAVHVGAFAIEHRDLRTGAEFVAAVEAAGPVPVLRAVCSEAMVGQAEASTILEAALAGDAAAAAELERLLPDWAKAERMALVRDAAGSHARLVAVLRAWLVPWATIERKVDRILRHDHAMRSEDRATLALGPLIEKTTGGIRWVVDPGVRRVILAPSYFSRPYNFLLAGAGWMFYGYPVADEALEGSDPSAPPPSVVRLHRALGDETRMRILKLLAEKDLYLTEIAGLLDLSKPTIKHHLALLRAAGLVTVLEAGAVMYYSLRRERLDDASADLKRFLVG
jgi:DNA-binding transcriptional ArsR family regulator